MQLYITLVLMHTEMQKVSQVIKIR